MQSHQGTVGIVQAQPIYTLELAVGDDVAHKEYMDYTRAKQAYNDAVADELALALLGITRVELFSEAVGSMDKWEAPALTSTTPPEGYEKCQCNGCSHPDTCFVPVPPAGGEPEVLGRELLPIGRVHDMRGAVRSLRTYEELPENEYPDSWKEGDKVIRLSDHRAHVTRLQAESAERYEAMLKLSEEVATRGKERDALQSELTKALALLRRILKTGVLSFEGEPSQEQTQLECDVCSYLAHQSAPAAKDGE